MYPDGRAEWMFDALVLLVLIFVVAILLRGDAPAETPEPKDDSDEYGEGGGL